MGLLPPVSFVVSVVLFFQGRDRGGEVHRCTEKAFAFVSMLLPAGININMNINSCTVLSTTYDFAVAEFEFFWGGGRGGRSAGL